MKFLKYFLLTFLILVGIYFVMGLIKPSLNYGHTITANKSVKEAWAVAQDPNKHGEWLDGFVSETLLSGEEGAVGSTYKVVVKPSPEEEAFEMTETIVSKNDFEHIAMHFESDFGEFDQKMSFSEKDGSTTVSTESVVKGKNLIMCAMMGWMETLTGSFHTQEEKNIERLKEVIEANTTNYFPTDSINAE